MRYIGTRLSPCEGFLMGAHSELDKFSRTVMAFFPFTCVGGLLKRKMESICVQDQGNNHKRRLLITKALRASKRNQKKTKSKLGQENGGSWFPLYFCSFFLLLFYTTLSVCPQSNNFLCSCLEKISLNRQTNISLDTSKANSRAALPVQDLAG